MERILNEWTVDEIKAGYRLRADGAYECAICGVTYQKGEVFPIDGHFYDQHRAIQMHVQAHGGVFEQLMIMDKKYTTLTENQAQLMRMMQAGMSDAQIAAELGVAASTVRHQRFMFREKARQAKAYLALFDLSIGSATPASDRSIPIHPTATMVDDRYQITKSEEDSALKAHFSSLDPLVLRSFPSKEKKKITVLRRIVTIFDPNKTYTELEVNARLKEVYDDFATIRRYLIEYGFMKRSMDGKQYIRCQGGENDHD